MTGEDLKRMQDNMLEGAKTILRESGRFRPVGFVITRHKHIEKLLETGWGVEMIDPKACVRDTKDDTIATLILDLLMDPKRLYHAVLNVFPQTRDVLPQLIAIGEAAKVDDPYKRVMRPFLHVTKLDEKDIVAAVMRQVCEKVDAFASIMQSEAWLRVVDSTEDRNKIPDRLGDDQKSTEVIISTMETHDFVRMVTIPIQRQATEGSAKRDEGPVVGFGAPDELIDGPNDAHELKGRLVRFLKPLEATP